MSLPAGVDRRIKGLLFVFPAPSAVGALAPAGTVPAGTVLAGTVPAGICADARA